MRKAILIFLVLTVALFAVGCAPKYTLNKPQYEAIRSVAVVGYTVPTKIKFSKDPTTGSSSSGKLTLASALKAAMKLLVGDGTKASTTSLKSFSEELNNQGLSFTVMSVDEVMGNPDFTALYDPSLQAVEQSGSVMGRFASMVAPKADKGKSPNMINNYGLALNWLKDTSYSGKDNEKEYVRKAIRALGVDAVILVNDPGYSFACEFCVGGTGAATTGSAFIVGMVGRDGELILELKQWFATTDEQAALVVGVINPLEQGDLYAEHGRKTARVFAKALKKALSETK